MVRLDAGSQPTLRRALDRYQRSQETAARRLVIVVLVVLACVAAAGTTAFGASSRTDQPRAGAKKPEASSTTSGGRAVAAHDTPATTTPAAVTGSGYVLESASAGTLGGPSSSPSYSGSAIAGQPTSSGEASSPSFSSSSGLLNDIDLDGDGVRGTDDFCPSEDATCSDGNVDGCIDTPDPDSDHDGVTRGGCDCNESNGTVWGSPGEVESLALTHNPANHQTTLTWPLPAVPGGTAVQSDLLRSNDPSNFTTNVDCVVSNDAGTSAIDLQSPSPGASFYYLVRAENLCPAQGSLGTDSSLHLRVGRSCP